MAAMRCSPVFAVALLVLQGLYFVPIGVQSFGVCYGMVADDLPSPSDVVQLYKSHGITNMRLYFAHNEALNALRGSGIGVVLGVPNENLAEFAASQSAAAAWIQTNVLPYHPDVNIRYIAAGNEVDGAAAQGSILPAMRNLNAALSAAGLSGSVKVSTAVKPDVIANSFPPSAAVFADQGIMTPIAHFLASTGAPLLANVYPYFAYKGNPKDISLDYATFRPGTTVKDDGNGLVYTNLFDAMLDAMYAALEKAGSPDVAVVVSESGWPSAGGFGASVENARAYNQNLINHVGQGTPKKKSPIETYAFAMFNENRKSGDPTENNFGLFYPNKTPVYPITFT